MEYEACNVGERVLAFMRLILDNIVILYSEINNVFKYAIKFTFGLIMLGQAYAEVAWHLGIIFFDKMYRNKFYLIK